MKTLYYKFHNLGRYEGLIKLKLKHISEEQFKKYISLLENINLNYKYELTSGSFDYIKFDMFEYTFIKPEVLFRKYIVDYDIINLFDKELKFILNEWLSIINIHNIYYDRIISARDNIDKLIEEAIIKAIIE